VLTAASASGQLVFLPLLTRLADGAGWQWVGVSVAIGALVAVPVVLSEKMRARVLSESQRAEKHCVMNSTICRHQNLAAQLFRTVMVQLRYACAAVHLWLTSQTKLVQIRQR
jgi:hypothetical protein